MVDQLFSGAELQLLLTIWDNSAIVIIAIVNIVIKIVAIDRFFLSLFGEAALITKLRLLLL